MTPISQRLFEEFERLNITPYKVAKLAGIHQPTFTKYRKGMQPTRKVMDKIVATFPTIDRMYIEFGIRNQKNDLKEIEPTLSKENTEAEKTNLEIKNNINNLLSKLIENQQAIMEQLAKENQFLLDILREIIKNL